MALSVIGNGASKHSISLCTWQLGAVRAADPGSTQHVRIPGDNGWLSQLCGDELKQLWCLAQEMESVLQNLETLSMSEPLEAEGTATSP